MNRTVLGLMAFALAMPATQARAEPAAFPVTISRPQISAAGALAMATAVRERAETEGEAVAVAIIDAGGNLVHFERMDGAVLATIDIAMAKARTAVQLNAPTQAFAGLARERSEQGMGLLSGGYSLMGGGRPIIVGGELVGAIAVSGARNDGDDSYAVAALDAIGAQR